MSADGFSPPRPDETGSGPNSNTGQKSEQGRGCLIDFLTVVIPDGQLERCTATDLNWLLPMIFGTRDELKLGSVTKRGWNFYTHQATIFDHNGEVCGKVGLGGNKETVCVSLSGEGCRWVRSWAYVANRLEVLHASISRVDLAYDDYDGKLIDLHVLRELARDGEGFGCGGRPPKSSFLDDHGSGKGCTLYVGEKGHKQYCAYEKGKQKGDDTSPWIRHEVRLYGKHIERLSYDILTQPLHYLRGAYPILQKLLPGIVTRLATVVRSVDASAKAMVKWLKTQTGPSLYLLMQAVGLEAFGQFVTDNVAREGRPLRFARCGAAPGDLPALIRSQLCPTFA